MRLVFAGTPRFAVPALEALAAAGHELVAVLTQPDRPAGRGLAAVAGPVKQAAQRRGVPVLQPPSLKDAAVQARLAELAPDALVVAAYGLILPQAMLDIPRLGALNVHASLLPRWRGAAPIERALLAGDPVTGVCIMQMDAGLDTGPVLLRDELPIAPEDTAGTLHDKLAALGARLVVAALDGLAAGTLRPTPQPAAGVTYAAKIARDETRLDWSRSANELARRVRAFDPAPGAGARVRGVELKIWRAAVVAARGAPGAVVAAGAEGISVACGDGGALRLEELQRAGGRRLPAAAFLRGFPLAPGDRFEPVTTGNN
jgi:methionyl-tRNA formyltransferase